MRIDQAMPSSSTERKLKHPFVSPMEEIRIELTRKSLHLLIAFEAILLDISIYLAIGSLIAGMIVYGTSEFLRHRGIQVPVIGPLTARAARMRDGNRFVIGPITLALGALEALILFDSLPAKIAIFALAFGDSFSSLIGKTFGRIPMPLSGGKSVEGSIFCFLAVLVSSYSLCGKLFPSVAIALATAFVEFWPTKDWDNLIIPLAAGLVASLLL